MKQVKKQLTKSSDISAKKKSPNSEVSLPDYLTEAMNSDNDLGINSSQNRFEYIEDSHKRLKGIINEATIRDAKFLLSSYNSNYTNSIKIDESKRKYTKLQLMQIDIGKALAENHKYIDALKKELVSSNTKENRCQFLIREQLLILDYWGILQKLRLHNTDDAISFFLAGLINRNPQEIRTWLGRLSSIKTPNTKANNKSHSFELLAIKRHFDSLRIRTVSRKIKADLVRLDKQVSKLL